MDNINNVFFIVYLMILFPQSYGVLSKTPQKRVHKNSQNDGTGYLTDKKDQNYQIPSKKWSKSEAVPSFPVTFFIIRLRLFAKFDFETLVR